MVDIEVRDLVECSSCGVEDDILTTKSYSLCCIDNRIISNCFDVINRDLISYVLFYGWDINKKAPERTPNHEIPRSSSRIQ